MRYDYILGLFVSADPIRPALQKPFQQEQFYIATDAHALFIVDKDVCTKQYESEHKAPNALKIFNDTVRNCDDVIGIDSLFSAQLHYDVAYTFKDCEKCKGEGVIECSECGHTHECEDCGGDGEVKKQGNRIRKKIYAGHDHITIGDAWFSPNVVDLLLNAMFILGINECTHIANHKNSANIFRLNEHCSVLIMPKAQEGGNQ